MEENKKQQICDDQLKDATGGKINTLLTPEQARAWGGPVIKVVTKDGKIMCKPQSL